MEREKWYINTEQFKGFGKTMYFNFSKEKYNFIESLNKTKNNLYFFSFNYY
jgi:hypothetical protein